jgi:hypothetical protein
MLGGKLQVIWFLNVAVQEQYSDQTVELRNRCERAGLLDGHWVRLQNREEGPVYKHCPCNVLGSPPECWALIE